MNAAPSSVDAVSAVAISIGAHPVPSVCSARGVIPQLSRRSQQSQNSSHVSGNRPIPACANNSSFQYIPEQENAAVLIGLK